MGRAEALRKLDGERKSDIFSEFLVQVLLLQLTDRDRLIMNELQRLKVKYLNFS